MTSLAASDVVPDFTLKNTSGGPVRLSEYQKGGPVLLVFFKHDCPTCQLAMPFLERIYRRCRGKSLAFLAVIEDGKLEAAAFAKEYAVMMPMVLDEAPYKASADCGLTNVPTVFLVDAGRRILLSQVGFHKKTYQEFADRAADLAGVPRQELFSGVDRVPESRPG